MTLMKIEVLPDTSTPAGGHAIIRLIGIGFLLPGATFRIDPIDDSMDVDHNEPLVHFKTSATALSSDRLSLTNFNLPLAA